MKSDFLNRNHRWLQIPTDVLAVYNCHDTVETAKLIAPLRETLSRNRQLEFFDRWFSTMVPVVESMMDRGVGELDYDAKEAYKSKLKGELRPLEKKILGGVRLFDDMEAALTGVVDAYRVEFPSRVKTADRKLASGLKKIRARKASFFNRGGERNNSDLAVFLYDYLGLKEPPETQKRPKRSVRQEALFYILQHLRKRDEPHRWVLEDLFHRSRLNTILSRYMTIEAEADGRVHPQVKLYGTETLRLAYAGDAGEAIQQWPKEARHIIRPRHGCVFLAFDYSQLEARILAYLSNDTAMMDCFEKGEDVHIQNARDLFGDGEVSSEMRGWAKTYLYGLSYGASPETLNTKLFCPCPRCAAEVPKTLDLTRDDIKRAADRWARKHRPVLEWRAKLLSSIKGPHGDHSWTSPWGYRRFFLQPTRDAERSIYNAPMQTCAAHLVQDAMIATHALNAPLNLQMHDELVFEVPVREKARWSEAIREVMEAPVKHLGGMRFPVSKKIGPDWGALKD